jgi:hypothetical protein
MLLVVSNAAMRISYDWLLYHAYCYQQLLDGLIITAICCQWSAMLPCVSAMIGCCDNNAYGYQPMWTALFLLRLPVVSNVAMYISCVLLLNDSSCQTCCHRRVLDSNVICCQCYACKPFKLSVMQTVQVVGHTNHSSCRSCKPFKLSVMQTIQFVGHADRSSCQSCRPFKLSVMQTVQVVGHANHSSCRSCKPFKLSVMQTIEVVSHAVAVAYMQ